MAFAAVAASDGRLRMNVKFKLMLMGLVHSSTVMIPAPGEPFMLSRQK
jgi:hypothetical protein